VADYFDTSVLLKLYVKEPNSNVALALVAGAIGPILFPAFLELELRTALRAKCGRTEITSQELSIAESQIAQDLNLGRFKVVKPPMSQVLARAEALSATHTMAMLTRTMDIIHVALAAELHAATFYTFDARQKALAAASGLKVSP
jgi:predicted nucleic acid-binding protein